MEGQEGKRQEVTVNWLSQMDLAREANEKVKIQGTEEQKGGKETSLFSIRSNEHHLQEHMNILRQNPKSYLYVQNDLKSCVVYLCPPSFPLL